MSYGSAAIGPVPAFPGYYVTDDGRVLSDKQGTIKQLKHATNAYGYAVVSLRRDGRSYKKFIHLLVLETFFGERPNNSVARHLDGDKENNSAPNLRWGSYSENERDKLLHGTGNQGARHGMSKLTEDDVREIRASAEPQRTLARQYQVSQSNISRIKRRATWRITHA